MAHSEDTPWIRDEESLRFLYGVCSRDPNQRGQALDNITRVFDGWLGGYGSPRESILDAQQKNGHLGTDFKHMIREQLPDLLRLSIYCPFTDVKERCASLLEDLKDRGMKIPSQKLQGPSCYVPEDQFPETEMEWQLIADEFESRWNFPHCLGALDGKHVSIRQPPHSGSAFYNYKHSFSLLLMALVDAEYNFIYIDVGKNGRVSDGGAFSSTALNTAMEEGRLPIPKPKPLPHANDRFDVPYMIVADEAFALRPNLMKPYPFRNLTDEQRVFNYRLSRARRVVENAFGILANRFRFLLCPILVTPDRAEKSVLAACALHNMLNKKSSQSPHHSHFHAVDENQDLQQQPLDNDNLINQENSTTINAKGQRDYLARYFNSTGAVEWQERMLFK